MTFVVLSVTAAGGWFYFDSARRSLRSSDRQHAVHLAQALGLAAQYDLRQGRTLALQRLTSDLLRNDNVRYVALLDGDGAVVASACRNSDPARWSWLTEMRVSVSTTRQVGQDVLALARPIVMRDVIWWEERLVGAVRIVLDTSGTARRLAAVQSRMTAVAGAIVLCGIPLGFLLVWRVVLKPLRRLVALTGRLAKGDFAARSKIGRSDEIGRLGAAFDSMAAELADMRDELIRANEQLERKVAARTEELQVTNARLRDEMVEKEDFLRAVSHDLNAPLRNIAGMATMAMMKWRDDMPEEVVARLQRIQANVDAEASLIGELLELSRIRSRPQKRQPADMGELIAAVGRTFEFELKGRGIDLQIAGGMPVLHVEPNRMRQVFQNLIDNAIKYMDRDAGGVIRVGYRRAGRMHEFCVADNGPGIEPDQQQRIFCVFRRAEGPAAAEVQGKGVGLALVKSVVANYDGRAWVASEPGQGASFFVALDVRNTQLPPEAAEESAAGKQHAIPAGHRAAGG